MKYIVGGLFFVASNFAFSAGDVNAFMEGVASMDNVSYQVMTDYRSYIQSKCVREVTVDELRAFSSTPVYMRLLALRTMSTSQTPEYQSTIVSISCK